LFIECLFRTMPEPVTETTNSIPAAEVAIAVVTPVAKVDEPKRKDKPDVFPLLEQLAALYPALFGATFLPLKRGIFQDLLAAHPDTFERDLLKAALSFHTRSTRYLTAVASGQQRHDLQGKPVEAMAPEHVHQALLEVFRRRQQRTPEDLQPKLIGRIVLAFEASGLSAQAYAELVRGRDEAANGVLEEALHEVEARAAKNEAVRRAFEASGQTVEVFADMYGMDARDVTRTLARTPTSVATI
jgi:sRNA-binding protein